MRLSFAITALAAVLSVFQARADERTVCLFTGDEQHWHYGQVGSRFCLPGSKWAQAPVAGYGLAGWLTKAAWEAQPGTEVHLSGFFAPWSLYTIGTQAADPYEELHALWTAENSDLSNILGIPALNVQGTVPFIPSPDGGGLVCNGESLGYTVSKMAMSVIGPCDLSFRVIYIPNNSDSYVMVDRVVTFKYDDYTDTNAVIRIPSGQHIVEWSLCTRYAAVLGREMHVGDIVVAPIEEKGDTRLIGTYAKALAPKEQLEPDTWRKYDPPELGKLSSARIQAFNDMMCERVDLMSTNYVPGADKTLLELPGCPSPAHRAAIYSDRTGVPALTLWAQLYGDMCAWVSREPKVETTPSSYDMVFPDRQSPLCKDIRLSVSDDGIVSHDTDTYPYSLYRFGPAPAKAASLGNPPHVITDIEDMLTNIAERLATSYKSDGAGVSRYTLTFTSSGHTSGSPPDPIVGYPQTETRIPGTNTLYRKSFRFNGWTSAKSGHFSPGDSYVFSFDDDSFVADWGQLYDIRISDGTFRTVYACSGDVITIPNPKTWENFVGWQVWNYGSKGRYYSPGETYVQKPYSAYIDAVYRTNPRPDSAEVAEVLGCPGYTFYGDSFWLEDGKLRSGAGYSFSGTVELDIAGPAVVSGYWGTQREGDRYWEENIGLYVDDTAVASSGGSTGARFSVSLGSGLHAFRFQPHSNRVPALCGYAYISQLTVTPANAEARSVSETNITTQAVSDDSKPDVSDADLTFCGFYEDDSGTPRFLDQTGPTSGDVIRWAPFYSFDRICADLSSRNVAVTDLTPYAGYVSRSRRSTYAYAFDTDAIRSWLAEFGNYYRTYVDDPEQAFAPHLEEIESTVSTNRRVSSAWATTSVTPKTPAAPSGSVTYTGNYVLDGTDSPFDVWEEGTDSYGNHYVHYGRYAYWAECVPNNPSVVFTSEPRAEIQVVAEDAGISLDTNEVFAANAAFHESPERFAGTKITALGRTRMTVSLPDEGVSWSTNVLAHATATSSTARATAAVLDGFGQAFRVQDAELEQFSLSPGDITFRITPTQFEESGYDLYEWRTVLNGSVTKTFAARYDDYHFPQATGYGRLAEPDYGRGETYAAVNYDGRRVPYSYTATFRSEYRNPSTRKRGTIIKSFTKPIVVFENEYDFTEWSGHLARVTDPTAGQGPRADYGDGDGGNEFDAYVDAAFIGTGDGSAERPFATIDAAISSVNPEGGSRAVEGRVPKIGIRAGRYAFPSFFEVTVNVETPYDVRLIGIGPDVVLAKSKTSVARLKGQYVSDLHTWIENLTVECSGSHLRSFTYFCFFNCRFTGSSTPKYSFIEAGGVFGSVFTNLSVFTRYEYSGSREPLIYGSQVEDCSLFLTPHPSGKIPLLEAGEMYNCAVVGGSWRRIQNKNTDGGLAHCTVYMQVLDEKDAPAAENCLFFADGLKTDSPSFVGNGTATAAEFKTLVDPGSLRPVESRFSWRDKGYRSYVRTY